MASGELRIDDALHQMAESGARNRTEGIANLNAKLKYSIRNPQSLTDDNDKLYARILEAVFKAAYEEKAQYRGAKNDTARTKAERGLLNCADTLRLAVQLGEPKMKRATFQNLIIKCAEFLSSDKGYQTSPFSLSFLRVLTAALKCTSQIERIQKECWLQICTFCIVGIDCCEGGDEANGPLPRKASLPLPVRNGGLRRARTNGSGAGDSVASRNRRDAEELVECLHSLITVSNAPLGLRDLDANGDGLIEDIGKKTIASTILFLSSQSHTVGNYHQFAFSIVNNLILLIGADESTWIKQEVPTILTIVFNLWSSKNATNDEMLNAAKDEMAVTLLVLRLHIAAILKDGAHQDLIDTIQDLQNVVTNDFCKRTEKDQLQIDDLDLTIERHGPKPDGSLDCGIFSLKAGVFRGERKWTAVQVLACLEQIVNCHGESTESSDTVDGDMAYDHRRKRRRVSTQFDALLTDLSSQDNGKKLLALKRLVFGLSLQTPAHDVLVQLLNRVLPLLADRDTETCGWAMLCLASTAHLSTASEFVDEFNWQGLWYNVRAMASNATLCRPACLLLHKILAMGLVRYEDVADAAASILGVSELTAPAIICDSSIELVRHLLTLTSSSGAAGISYGHTVIRWFFMKWNIADKSMMFRPYGDTTSLQIYNLLRTAVNLPCVKLSYVAPVPCGILGQKWIRHLRVEPALRYLLLLYDKPEVVTACQTCSSTLYVFSSHDMQTSKGQQTQGKELIADLLLPRLEAFCSELSSQVVPSPSQSTTELANRLISAALITCLIVSILDDFVLFKRGPIESAIQQFCVAISDWELGSNNGIDEVRTILQQIRPFLPAYNFEEMKHFHRSYQHLSRLYSSCAVLARTYQAFRENISGSDDPMDIDSMFDTHQSASRGNAELSLAHREHLSMSLDDETLLSTTIVRLFFTTAFETDDAEIPHIPPRFLVHLSELSSAEFIVCCSDIGDVLQSDFQPTPEDAKKLLEQISSIVGDKLYTTCEVAQIAAVAIMKGLLPLWSSGTVGPLEQQAFDLYEWFVVEIPKAVPSPAVRIALADFLVSLMRCSVHYGEERGLRSPRSSIFDLVQRSPLAVKFHTARLLPDMFSLFIWPDHNRILEDLLDCIPNSLGWNEGQAFRLSVLANVGARWPNLLRSCLYYIVEVPGVMPGAVDYAEKCVFDLSQKLNLADPQALFDLFGSQILYTWLEVQSFEHFPFRIFGYSEFNDFLVDAEVEIAALMVMRNRDAEVERLAVAIGVTTEDLIASSFTKIIAYSIAHDLQHPHVASGSPYQTGEVRIRNLLGRDRYRALIEKHFVDIISASFRHMDHEVDMEKSLSRQPEFVQSAKTLRSIKSCGASSLALPPNQQPNFKAKYLSRQISHICSRTQYALESIFTAPMFVSIARSLLNSINPALGSLHTCSIVRKLRVLLGFAGPVSLSGYPLEMIMHGLRSLVVDTECRPDVIGILKYLMERGAPYLATVPKFTAGFVLSYYGTLKALFDRPASSYSQQSQYLGTVSEVQDVNDWLSGYLQRYQETVPGKLRKSFETITNAAKHARSTRVDNQNPTGELLLEFLRDEREGRKLLVPETADLAFSLLFEQFTPPDSYRDDELGSDTRAVRYSGVLWALVRRCNLSSNFFTWAARAIGRAFAASGSVEPSLLRETDLSQILAYGKEAPPGGHSETSLLRQLYSHTLVDHGKVTGLAEICLRLTLGSLRSEVDTVLVAATNAIIPPSLRDSSIWTPYCVPPSDQVNIEGQVARQALSPESIHKEEWVQSLSLFLVQTVKKDKLLWPLQHLLTEDAAFAQSAFPFILHVALSSTVHDESMKGKLSAAFTDWLRVRDLESKMRVKLIINSLLYLRTQEYPKEESIVDRALWLDIDNSDIIDAALFCGMHRTALLFTEVAVSMQNSTTRRSSLLELVDSQKVLSIVFQNVDDPDAFYGLQQPASLSTVYNRLDYERDGLKALMFTGAQYDSQMRRGSNMGATADEQLINALAYLNMDGLSHAFLRARHTSIVTNETIDNMYDAARKLEQWDLPVPTSHESSSITLYETLQALSTANTRHSVQAAIDTSLSSALSRLIGGTPGPSTVHSLLQNLAILTEMDEAFSSTSSEEFEDMIKRFESRAKWMPIGRFEDVSQIVSHRDTMLSTLSKRPILQKLLNINAKDARHVEVNAAIVSSRINRAHGALQNSLRTATYLNGLVGPCNDLGLRVEAAARLEVANALWDQGESTTSIRMLQDLESLPSLNQQDIRIPKSTILAKLASQVSSARLEKPDRIIQKYLEPALAELKNRQQGEDAGKVYREFAVFCDRQYNDPDGVEDFARAKKLRDMKLQEIEQLEALQEKEASDLKNKVGAKAKSMPRRHESAIRKARQWLALDGKEFERLEAARMALLKQSIENYLLSLAAWDEEDSDALRFVALWLEHWDSLDANKSVESLLGLIPSYKFANLSNQLTSRLLNEEVLFQELLSSLVLRICRDHPYHSMHQVWTAQTAQPAIGDITAMSRQKAAERIALNLYEGQESGKLWASIDKVNKAYLTFAAEGTQGNEKYRTGQRLRVQNSPGATVLSKVMTKYLLPPLTYHIPLRSDKDYSRLPTMAKLDQHISIANGMSAPKVINIVASNGGVHKQLVKGGTDDLRQDSIMEQVFGQVSDLMQTITATRQRNLGIRTYKVIPLSTTAGILEFVKNTVAVHGWLVPAHEKYHPKDWKADACRTAIGRAVKSGQEKRVKVFQEVCQNFKPVLRYFFMERYQDPDEWFAKRTAYTRSTAAISILGHVLGIGDRHGHNILLDEKSGEIVHIDLGVAFEVGRILAVPEVVPFRLTRDIVDGMGITQTEGVFRRCCEFVLDALRQRSDTIMTVLDVLRYDPLYNWTLSPIRLAKLQQNQDNDQDDNPPSMPPTPDEASKAFKKPEVQARIGSEPSEADRALTVVKKKLSKTLSVQATVNDLINQAVDEKNLAVLFSGWGAYA